MPRFARVFPLSLALAALALGPSLPACKSKPRVVPDAGTSIATGALLTRFDALAPGAVSGYGPRVLLRLGIAKPQVHEVVAAMPAGLSLRVTWETRDDLVFARRYLTLWKVTVDAIATGTSCAVRGTQPAAPQPTDGIASMRISLSIDYRCVEGRSSADLAVAIGSLNEDGFTRIGAATGAMQPIVSDGESVAVAAVHFAPKSAALDAAATTVVEEHAKVLKVDPELGLCFGYHSDKTNDTLQTKRREAVRQLLVDRGIARTRLGTTVGAEQRPPADDDIELYPHEKECVIPSRSTKRR